MLLLSRYLSISVLAAVSTVPILSFAEEGWMQDSDSPTIRILDVPQGAIHAYSTINVSDLPDSPPPRRRSSRSGGDAPPDTPDCLTPEIVGLVQGVLNEPSTNPAWAKCFLHVANELRYEHYYGSKKGAHLTLLEQGGNDADLATLLVAMLREAGYAARYGHGIQLFLTEGHPDGFNLEEWLGVPTAAVSRYNASRGFPATYTSTHPQLGSLLGFDRVWVEVSLGGQWHRLDPAAKRRTRVLPAMITPTTSGYDRAALLAAAAGTSTSTYVEGLDERALGELLSTYSTALVNQLEIDHHGTDPVNLVGGFRSERFVDTEGKQPVTLGIVQSQVHFDDLPQALLTHLSIDVKSTASGNPTIASLTMPMANLRGRRLALTFTDSGASGRAQLFLDDDLIAQEASASTGDSVLVEISIDHPHDNGNGADQHDSSSEKAYERGASYALFYAFNPSGSHLRERQKVLDGYRRDGYSDSSREVVTETLNVIGLTWMHQTELVNRILGSMTNIDTTAHHRMGRVSQESGYYIDVGLEFAGFFSIDNDSVMRRRAVQSYAYFSSAFEHAVIEQLQGAASQAVSTTKLLRLANQQPASSKKIFFANVATWPLIKLQLQNYSAGDLAKIQSAIDLGGIALVPQNGNIKHNNWTGTGYVLRVNENGTIRTTMGISGDLNGGYSSVPGQVNTPFLSSLANSNPNYINSSADSHAPILSADPVDLSTGAYYLPPIEFLSVGLPEPRGFSFVCSYNSARSSVDPSGMGFGWTHSYMVRATRRSAYEPALGLTGTPYDVASALVAASTMLDLASTASDAKTESVSGFVANWLTDQLLDNAMAVSLGDRSLQFVRRANGSWQSPPGVTSTLVEHFDGTVILKERHGNEHHFDQSGLLFQVRDTWGKTLSVTHNGDGKIAQAIDAFGRSLTFTYSGGKLSSVADSTGRSISLSHDAAGDLVTIADEESKERHFIYDDSHRVVDVINHDGETVATNHYDPLGRVDYQYSHGNPLHRWRFYYSSQCTVEEDPAGGKRSFYFDHRRRLVRLRNALGRNWRSEFDGQDRLVEQRTPLGRTTIRSYDQHHNLLSFKDPDNWVTTHEYDAEQRPWRTTFPPLSRTETRTETRTFNAEHQVLTITNAENETTKHSYNPVSGVLLSTTDPDTKTTGYAYDGFDQLLRINHPNEDSDTTIRNLRGDIVTRINGRTKRTTMTYNDRRQLLVTTLPDTSTESRAYDNQGMLQSETDGLNHTTSYLYSPTGTLLKTTYADLTFEERRYDSRDWLEEISNQSNETTTYTRDAAGNISRETDPLGRKTDFAYDLDGRLRKTRDNHSKETQQDFDDRDHLVADSDRLGQSASYVVDAGGRRISYTNRRGHTYTFGFDGADRLLLTTSPEGRDYSRTWNDRSLLETVTEPSQQTTTFTHDDKGRVITRADQKAVTSYTYDRADNLTRVSEYGIEIVRKFDDNGRMESYTNGRGHEIGYEYDAANNLVSLTYEPGKTVVYKYDMRNRIKKVTDWSGRVTEFERDDSDRLTEISRPNYTKRSISWDAAGQLNGFSDRHVPTGEPVVALRAHYDGIGLMTRKLELPVWAVNDPLPSRPATHDRDNRLLMIAGSAVTHDYDGNITALPSFDETGGQSAYSWNPRNQLTGAPGISDYQYDAEGERTQYTESGGGTIKFVVDPSDPLSRVLIRIRPDGSRTFYIYGSMLLYEIEESTNETRHYHYDHFGSTIALTDDRGAVTGRANYSAYGLLIQSKGLLDTPFLWHGAFGVQTDPNGLYYMRARYFNPHLGRFMSEDPLGLAAGSNVFHYANGNPIMANDPTGKFAWVLAGASIGAVVDVAITVTTHGSDVTATDLFASAGRGAVAGALSTLAGPAGGTIARAGLGLPSAGAVARTTGVGLAGGAGVAGQVVHNLTTGEKITDGLGTSFVSGAGSQAVAGFIRTQGLYTLNQASYFAPSNLASPVTANTTSVVGQQLTSSLTGAGLGAGLRPGLAEANSGQQNRSRPK